MRGNGIFHPRFFYHPRPVVNSAQVAYVQVFKPTGGVPRWNGTDSMENNLLTLVWEGHARIQPNKDWRARPREFAGEFDATQAVRVQLPIGENHLGATFATDGTVVTYGADVEFFKDYEVKVVSVPVEGALNMVGNTYFVRNAMTSTNLWVYNLLCDTNTKSGGQSG